MKKMFVTASAVLLFTAVFAQEDIEKADPSFKKAKEEKTQLKAEEALKSDSNFSIIKTIAGTPVKNQAMTGTCWCFSTTSLLESQCIKNNIGELDLSEMFTVRNTYIEKAKNYLLRQGNAQFGEGGLGHDLVNAVSKYGAMPEAAYSGLKEGQTQHNHTKLVSALKSYLDNLLKSRTLPEDWQKGYTALLDSALGTPPEKFTYKGKEYTPKSFATEVLKFNAADYVYITSFTHQPYYTPFIINVPDNFSNGAYYNLPLEEMIQVTRDAVNTGYSVMWDADVSNEGFQQKVGTAYNFYNVNSSSLKKGDMLSGQAKEGKWDAATRQQLYENLTTQDDHLMHIVGLVRSKSGAEFFRVKNSWGDVGPRHGYINVSEGYFAINTISLVIPKAAISKKMLEKLKIQ